MAKQCRALYTKYAYGHTYGLLKVGLRDKEMLKNVYLYQCRYLLASDQIHWCNQAAQYLADQEEF